MGIRMPRMERRTKTVTLRHQKEQSKAVMLETRRPRLPRAKLTVT